MRGVCAVFPGVRTLLQVLCSAFRVHRSVFRVPCTLLQVLCGVFRVLRSVFRVACTLLQVLCDVCRVLRRVLQELSSVRRALCSVVRELSPVFRQSVRGCAPSLGGISPVRSKAAKKDSNLADFWSISDFAQVPK
jgi:hypothetical protein